MYLKTEYYNQLFFLIKKILKIFDLNNKLFNYKYDYTENIQNQI